MSIKKIFTAVFVAIAILFCLAIEAQGAERYQERTFVYGSYAPVVQLRHGAYGWGMQAKADGSLGWAKADKDSWSQSFVILPSKVSGYYIIREFTNEHSQRVVTYTPKGFVLEYPGHDKNYQTVYKDTQLFKFKWYSSVKDAGKTEKNVWRAVCRKNSICMCTGGWSAFKMLQINAPD